AEDRFNVLVEGHLWLRRCLGSIEPWSHHQRCQHQRRQDSHDGPRQESPSRLRPGLSRVRNRNQWVNRNSRLLSRAQKQSSSTCSGFAPSTSRAASNAATSCSVGSRDRQRIDRSVRISCGVLSALMSSATTPPSFTLPLTTLPLSRCNACDR